MRMGQIEMNSTSLILGIPKNTKGRMVSFLISQRIRSFKISYSSTSSQA
jgi:hypothetical protein